MLLDRDTNSNKIIEIHRFILALVIKFDKKQYDFIEK